MSIRLIVGNLSGDFVSSDGACFWHVNIEEPILFTGKTVVISVAPQ